MKKIAQLFFLFFLSVFFSQCVSKKAYTSKVSGYEKRISVLKADSTVTHDQLTRMKQDSISTQSKLAELTAYKEKSEGKNASALHTKKPKTISEEKEYDDMATFIYNITKYVEWPAEAKRETFKIGILGKSKIENVIRTKVANKKSGGQKFEVQVFSSVKDIKDCHILVISKGNPSSIAAIKSKLGKFPTLLITEEDDYIRPGSHVNLRVDGDDVKMAVNKDTVKSAKFKVSKTLLSLSEE